MLDPVEPATEAWKKRLALAVSVRQLLDGAAFVHVLNADEAALIAPLGLRATCVVLPNGIFLEEIEPLPDRGSFVTNCPQLQGRRFALFLARLQYKKGLDYLAAAWEPEWKNNAQRPISSWPVRTKEHKATLRSRSRPPGFRIAFTWLGLCTAADPAAIVDATCFCLPSRQEGFV